MKKYPKTTEKGTWSNNLFILRLLLKICPRRVTATLFQSFISYFAGVFFSIIFMRYIFDSFDIERSFNETVLFVCISMAMFFLLSLYSSWYNKKYRPITDQIICYKLNKILFDKATNVDISCFENPKFYNNYTSAITEANGRAIAVLDNIADIISAILSSVFIIYTMFTLDMISILFIVIPVVGSFVFNKLANKAKYCNYMDDIPYNRQKEYVSRVVFLKKYAKEIRLSNIFNVLKSIYERGYQGIYNNVDKYKNQNFIFGFLRSFLNYPIAFETVWLYAAYRVMVTKSLNMSEFIVLASAIVSVTNMLLGLVSKMITASENVLYIQNFKTFLNYKEKISESQDGLILKDDVSIIEFKNVSFTYEGQDAPVLKNINLKIKSDEMVALIGHNGSGKTTLVKLIMRLYDVTEGEILLNGTNIKKYNVKEYRNLFSTVFQNFQIMAMSILENVCMCEIINNEQRNICEMALKESGILDKVNSFRDGIDTILTREFDDQGVVLSGGEAQKIAIARVYAKDNPIIILDEPSSALDPMAEYEIFESLTRIYSRQDKAKMVILISHRLSFAILASKVYLLEKGEIIEEGSHVELMKKNGKYAELFMKQAKSYIENDDEFINDYSTDIEGSV